MASPVGDPPQVEDTDPCNEDGQCCGTVTALEFHTESGEGVQAIRDRAVAPLNRENPLLSRSKQQQYGSYLTITSYGYRLGPLNKPRSPDLVIDVRNVGVSLNSVRDKHNGFSNRLKKEFFSNDEAAARLEAALRAVETLMENFEQLEKSSLRVGVGCGAGRRRSVAFAEELGRRTKRIDWVVEVHHRDVWRQNHHLQQRTPLP
ncbi:MAG: hypothetical protein M1830_005485 [Pleopsidium flavum]|nr:MAG: hypothetical protein M1830_005485 [Pleopsidium flavum]